MKSQKICSNSSLLNEQCSICLFMYVENDVVLTTTCKHAFHERCLKGWMKTCKRSLSCPVCRFRLQSSLLGDVVCFFIVICFLLFSLYFSVYLLLLADVEEQLYIPLYDIDFFSFAGSVDDRNVFMEKCFAASYYSIWTIDRDIYCKHKIRDAIPMEKDVVSFIYRCRFIGIFWFLFWCVAFCYCCVYIVDRFVS